MFHFSTVTIIKTSPNKDQHSIPNAPHSKYVLYYATTQCIHSLIQIQFIMTKLHKIYTVFEKNTFCFLPKLKRKS